MFKNESDVVAKKAEKRYEVLAKQKMHPNLARKELISPEPLSSMTCESKYERIRPGNNTTQVVSFSRYPTPESITREIVPSIEDQALGFFIGNYVAEPTFVPRGQFEWVTELLAQPETEDILRQSVTAASLAGFANATKNPTIMQQAQSAYGSALRLTNSALQVKETATRDIQAWAKHVDGACALLNLRGEQQFQSNLGRRLFHQFYGVILLVALETGRPVHEGMHKLYRVMTPTSDYNVHGRAWTTRLVDLVHSSIYLNQSRNTDPKTMVERALNLDHELDKIKALMPNVWDYEKVYYENSSHYLYGELYHIYLDPWIAQMWNNVHSCRLCLLKIVRENLTMGWVNSDQPLFSKEEHDSIKVAAEEKSRATAAAIIASVPQITGMIPFPDLSTAKRRASDPAQSLRYTICPPGTYIDTAHSTHMLHLIWPLYAAGGLELTTAEMRQWIINILHHVALRIGNRQAVVLADELKEIQRTGIFTTPWSNRTAYAHARPSEHRGNVSDLNRTRAAEKCPTPKQRTFGCAH
ncbi:hypothetical protein BDU57DRAFT_525360 [Ampelomyces quisqualis]|uniref:Fungal-specific transcription factor domain-containing protein n=1 Tax=Ampelomyces quisqualis TaxID=50730 RepID=A0A6A5QZD7_AMPQU|nr:hypothetical protein BDU57DRAFT_525360 [Ampelomyces quisqualis]